MFSYLILRQTTPPILRPMTRPETFTSPTTVGPRGSLYNPTPHGRRRRRREYKSKVKHRGEKEYRNLQGTRKGIDPLNDFGVVEYRTGWVQVR